MTVGHLDDLAEAPKGHDHLVAGEGEGAGWRGGRGVAWRAVGGRAAINRTLDVRYGQTSALGLARNLQLAGTQPGGNSAL